MDWITVAVNYINEFPPLSKNINVKCMQIYSYISSIDIIYEGVKQLHRSINDSKNRKSPFENENQIFKSGCDDKYFKEIRARFGAHPVNLDGQSGEKLYASWPYEDRFGDYDLKIRLYSNLVEKEDTTFKIKLSELNEYLIVRYNYLEILIEKLNDQYQQFCCEQINREIETSDNINQQLQILLKESKLRIFEEYTHIIETLIIIFNTTTGIESLKIEEENFKIYLFPLINEIRNNLQNMSLADLNNNIRLQSNKLNKEFSYELPKLNIWIFTDNGDPLVEFYLKRLNEYSNFKYQFDVKNNKKVILLKLQLLFYFFNNE
ncbi:hypothetical protein [Orbus hercynius]|nr:hypothetical protein [Orbus hercynius]